MGQRILKCETSSRSWETWYSCMWLRVIRYKATTVSEELTAIFMLEVEAVGFSAFYPSAELHDPQPRRRCYYLNLTGIGRGGAEWMGSSDVLLCRQYVPRNAEIPFVPAFPRQSQFYFFQRPVFWCTAKLGSGRQRSWVFPRQKSTIFLKLRTNFLTHHIARKDLDELSCHHQPLTGRNRRGSGRCVD